MAMYYCNGADWSLALWDLRAYLLGLQWRDNDRNTGYEAPILQLQKGPLWKTGDRCANSVVYMGI